MKCWQIDERLPFFLEGSTLRHDHASNKTFCLIYRIAVELVQSSPMHRINLGHVLPNFKGDSLQITPFAIPRRLLSLQLKTAPLVSPIVEQKTTPGDSTREKNVTSKNNTNQNTTRATHNDSVRQQVLMVTKGTDDMTIPTNREGPGSKEHNPRYLTTCC